MVFLVAGDILAVAVFPLLLAGIGVLVLYPYTVLVDHVGLMHLSLMDPTITGSIVVGTFSVAYSTGTGTPHLRNTPSGLARYLGKFIGILLIAEVPMICLHFCLTAIFRSLGSDYAFWIEILCLIMGGLIFYFVSRRTFLFVPEPGGERELVRGEDLRAADDVEWRAWRDEHGR